jgi:hypothetical protein
VNYGAPCETFTTSQPNLANVGVGWADKASSIRVAPGFVSCLYNLNDYTGNKAPVVGNDPDLSDLPFYSAGAWLRSLRMNDVCEGPAPGFTGVPKNLYRAEYFNNQDVTGSPVLTRVEERISNDWGANRPYDGVNNDGFSARWVGRFDFEAGPYNFQVRADDGVRLWVDGQIVIDEWHGSSGNVYVVQRNLTAGEKEVKVEYFEGSGGASIYLEWKKDAQPGGTSWTRLCQDPNYGGTCALASTSPATIPTSRPTRSATTRPARSGSPPGSR